MLNKQIQSLLNKIEEIKAEASRSKDKITVVAVSKGQPLEKIKKAISLDIRNFGENYVQEAILKIRQLSQDVHQDVNQDMNLSLDTKNLYWHFIGRIQSNKTKDIATHFDFVQSLETFKHAKLLNDARPKEKKPLNICVQVNLPEITHPAGVLSTELFQFIDALMPLERLKIRGLMFILQENISSATLDQQRSAYKKCYELFQSLKSSYPFLDTLSMGMSQDFEAAILEGSTMLRIGTALFGARSGQI